MTLPLSEVGVGGGVDVDAVTSVRSKNEKLMARNAPKMSFFEFFLSDLMQLKLLTYFTRCVNKLHIW